MAKMLPRLALSFALLMAACGEVRSPEEVAGPDNYVLPASDPSLDPEHLSVGDIIEVPCGPVGPRAPDPLAGRYEWATVDIYFGRPTAEGPWGAPTGADSALVRKHGGRILYLFHLPVIRARMILARVPELATAGYWIWVRGVPDPTRYDVPLGVRFDRPLVEADIEQFGQLGGRVDRRIDSINALYGVLPDRSIPTYQARSDVQHVQTNGVYCLM